MIHKEIIVKLNFIKSKNLSSEKDNVRRIRRQAETGRKYLQMTHLIKSLPKIYKELLRKHTT